jgi:hypothetical protein
MAGAIAIVVVMVLVLPLGVMLAGAVWSAIFGWLLHDNSIREAESSS